MLRVLHDGLTTANDRQVTLIALLDLLSIRLCRSQAASTPTAVQFRLHRRHAALDDVVRFRPDATGFLRRSAVGHSSSTVHSSTGVRPRPPTLSRVNK